MALFGKKKNGEAAAGAAPTEEAAAPSTSAEGFSPEKARKFFDHARHMHETTNYAYAMQLWLNGLRWDPGSEEGFEGFVNSAHQFRASDDKKTSSRDIAKGLQGKGRILKFQEALLEWGLKPEDMNAALKGAEAAGTLGVTPITTYLGRQALAQARGAKRQKKDTYVRLMNAFEKAGEYTLAVEAGEDAKRLDNSDGDLARHVNQLSAQSAITRGGFGDGAEEGGFRRSIRDVEKQTQLEAQDRLTKTDDVKDRLVAAAEAEYDERPDDTALLEKFARALVDRGQKADLLKAMALYNKAYQETGQFRFRERSGDVQLQQMRRTVDQLATKAKKAPEDEKLASKLETARQELTQKEIEELRLQIENYPTDPRRKFYLGKLLHETGQHHEAIEMLQLAQDDPKLRSQALRFLAESFLAIGGWEDAAIDTFRQALDTVEDDSSEVALELRYGLMRALQEKAEKDREADSADEADRLAGAIAMKKFNYRDVQERRKKIKSLLQELRAG